MKLRNKKTGEIDDYIFEVIRDRIDLYRRVGYSDTKNVWHYNSISELNAEWEDYEEPKEYWYIDTTEGTVVEHTQEMFELTDKERKEIGNYFDTRAEAEKAVEKLKAWKRLKDKGFKFDGVEVFSEGLIEIDGVLPTLEGADNAERLKIIDDLNLLFPGGEE